MYVVAIGNNTNIPGSLRLGGDRLGKAAICRAFEADADERTRTSTWFPRHGPEPCASTNSATSACGGQRRYRTGIGGTDARAGGAGPVGRPATRSGALLASIRRKRAAIVQGTRTPPSHGGNPGSNPGSGTSGKPRTRGAFVVFRGRALTKVRTHDSGRGVRDVSARIARTSSVAYSASPTALRASAGSVK